MYLVVVAVDTPGWLVDRDQLHRTLWVSAARSDLLQHVHIGVKPGRAVLSLYLQAVDRSAAVALAGQLARRSMATMPAARRWRIRSVRTL